MMVSCGHSSSLSSNKKSSTTPDLTSTSLFGQKEKHDVQLSRNEQTKFEYFFLEAEKQMRMGNNDAAFDLFRHCLQINQYSPIANYKMGQYYAVMRNDSAAIGYFETAAAEEPDNVDYLEIVAQYYIHQQKFDKAIPVYEQIYSSDKDRSDILETLLKLYYQKSDMNKAIDVLDRIETVEGSSERITLTKAQLYGQLGKDKEALAQIDKLASEHPYDLVYQTLKGDWLMDKGKTKEALDIYDKVLKEDPENPSAKLSMLNYYKSQKQDSVANGILKSLLTSDKTDIAQKVSLMRSVVAENEMEGGDSTQVISLFNDVLREPQKSSEMLVMYSIYLNSKGMPHDSVAKVLYRVLDVEPENSAARLQLIQYAAERKDYDEIIEIAKPATEYSPDEMAFYYYLGLSYYLKNDLDGALNTFRKGVSVINEQSDPALVSDYYAIMGDILHTQGNAGEAFAAYDSCLQWKNDNIGCLNNYAYYLSEQGQNLDKAEQMSYKTIKSEPNNSTYLDTYAWILFMQKRYEEAKIYIDQAVKNDSAKSSTILEHAGDIYAMNNDIDQALNFWNDAASKADSENATLIRKIKLKKYLKK